MQLSMREPLSNLPLTELRVHPRVETKEVTLSRSENFDLLNQIAASIYEQYVSSFLGRDLIEVERVAVNALRPPATNEPGNQGQAH
jgi:hypothetical protein